MIAKTPQPPYYAVIFTNVRTEVEVGYKNTADRMMILAREQDGFLGVDSIREDIGITISYWADLASIEKWKNHAEHSIAREKGREQWYKQFILRIAKVEREYSYDKKD